MFVAAVRAFLADNRGTTAIEYALIGTIIGVALVTTMTVVGGGLENLFNNGAADVLAQQSAKIP
jgi:pilus assembly protein Flp/PilA